MMLNYAGFLLHRKSIKKLVLKNLKPSQVSSLFNSDTDDLASPSEYPQNGHRWTHASHSSPFGVERSE